MNTVGKISKTPSLGQNVLDIVIKMCNHVLCVGFRPTLTMTMLILIIQHVFTRKFFASDDDTLAVNNRHVCSQIYHIPEPKI